ncbi:MAG TPA: DUF992 domain-containing protein [Rhizomicrobium sp.]|nr:DUF992 domain-containing protein [Rhizomicrobium sp.]
MLKRIVMTFTAAALLAAGVLASGDANAQGGVKIGTLTCSVSSGFGFIFGSSRDIRCTYQSARGTIEHYSGHISKFGVDIGYTRAGVIVWAVFAPSSTLAPGALAGDYGGATAGATVGVGVGVHALVGGFRRSISLQPLSIEGNTGLNVAAGIAQMTLRHAA